MREGRTRVGGGRVSRREDALQMFLLFLTAEPTTKSVLRCQSSSREKPGRLDLPPVATMPQANNTCPYFLSEETFFECLSRV